MAITVKDWRNYPETTTPITAEALEDLEQRLGDYADALSDAAIGLGTKLDTTKATASGLGYMNHGVTAGATRPTGWAAVLWVGSVSPTNAVDGDVWIDTT